MHSTVLSINLLWQQSVPIAYIETATVAIEQAINQLDLRQCVRLVIGGTEMKPDDPEESVECYMHLARESAMQIGLQEGQADIRALAGLLHEYAGPPDQGKPRPFLIANDDYAIVEEPYVFGHSFQGFSATVSAYRFQHDERIQDRLGAFAASVIHECGHLLGAPNRDRGSALQEFFGIHCTNGCVMRQRDDLPEWEADILPGVKRGPFFCQLCAKDIHAYLQSLLIAS